MNPNEQQWAAILQASRQAARRGAASISARKKANVESIRRAKKYLRDAVEKQAEDAAFDILGSLIRLRAEQTVLAIEEIETEYGRAATPIIRAHVSQYIREAAALARATEIILFGQKTSYGNK